MAEFGKGLTYCLGLFLAHSERRVSKTLDESTAAGIWFDGAADHLFELQVPPMYPIELKNRLIAFQQKCLSWRYAVPSTRADVRWAIEEAEDLLMEIDKVIGVATEESECA